MKLGAPVYGIKFKQNYCHELYGINKVGIINNIRECFDDFMKIFTFYFELISKEKVEPITLFQNINVSKIITFNYTLTYQYYSNFPKDANHVHGRFDKNNLVLGFHDENPEKLDFVYFKKYYQSIIKTELIFKRGDCDLNFGNYPSEIHLIGHSLDISDEDKIKEIFSIINIPKEAKTYQEFKFYFYYYNNQDLESEYVNLMKLLTKETFLEHKKNGVFNFILIK